MKKAEYLEKIMELMDKINDLSLLDLIKQLLEKSL